MRLHVVLRDALTEELHPSEVVLRLGHSLFSRQSIPPHRFGVVLRDTTAIGVHHPEVVLRTGISLTSRMTHYLQLVTAGASVRSQDAEREPSGAERQRR